MIVCTRKRKLGVRWKLARFLEKNFFHREDNFVMSINKLSTIFSVCSWHVHRHLLALPVKYSYVHHHHHLSLNREGRWGTTDYFAMSSIFPCSPLPSGTRRTQGLSISWCCLPTSSSVCLIFFPLSLCLAWRFWPDPMNGRHDHTFYSRRVGISLTVALWMQTHTTNGDQQLQASQQHPTQLLATNTCIWKRPVNLVFIQSSSSSPSSLRML